MKTTGKMSKAFLGVCFTILFIFVIAGQATAQTCVQPPTGLIGWWPGDGNANDIQGGLDGTLIGDTSFAAGRVGQAFSFDGNGDQVDTAAGGVDLNGASGFGVSFWMNPSSNPPSVAANTRNLVRDQGSFAIGHQCGPLCGNPSAKTQLFCTVAVVNASGTVAPHRIASFPEIPLNAWSYVACTWDNNTTMKIYINGQLRPVQFQDLFGTGAITDSNTGPVSLGSGPNGDYHGLLDEVQIVNRTLTAAEILAEYNAGSAGKCKPPPPPENTTPVAIAGTSLDGNDMLQLDGTLSFDPDLDPLTFSWQVDGEAAPRSGQIASIADLAVGDYLVDLTVSDGLLSDTDSMLFGVPTEAGVVPPTPDVLQQAVNAIKDQIIGLPTSGFDAPNDKARENRRKALLNMLDNVFDAIGASDFQGAIDQLRDVLAKSDGLGPPDSAPDWIVGTDAQTVAQAVADLIGNLLVVCGTCS